MSTAAQNKKGNRRAPSTGSSRGTITTEQREAIARQQAEYLQTLGQEIPASLGQRRRNTVNGDPVNLTLGMPALDINAQLTPEGVAGRYLGLGTYSNIVLAPHAFNTKQTVNITATWAGYLNKMKNSLMESLVLARQDGIPDYSIGLYGTDSIRDNSAYTRITEYSPDSGAHLFVSTVDGAPLVLLPGSTQQRLAAQRGYSVGQVTVENPITKKNVKVGSQGWRKVLAMLLNGTAVVSNAAIQKFIGQGAVYGLGPIFAKHGIEVVPEMQNGEVTYNIPAGWQSVASNAEFIKDVGDYYDAYLKNPDQENQGYYAAASFAARHQGGAIEGSGDAQGLTGQDFIDTIQDGLNSRNLKGLYKFKTGNKTAKDRRGLTAFPLRNKDGTPRPRDQYFSNTTGYCNVAGGGVGVSQRATLGGEYDYKANQRKRTYYSNAAGRQGEIIPGTVPLYSCKGVADPDINTRRDIYQMGQERGTTNYGIVEAINAAQEAIQRTGEDSDYAQFSNLTVQELQNRYDAATDPANFAKYRRNPNYMLDPNTMGGRRGFFKAAPKLYAAAIEDPVARAEYQSRKPNRYVKDQQSDAILAAITKGRTPNSRTESGLYNYANPLYKGELLADNTGANVKPYAAASASIAAMNAKKTGPKTARKTKNP